MVNNSAEMKMGWRNGIIGLLTSFLVSFGVRLSLWITLINGNRKYAADGKTMTMILLVGGFLIPVLCYLSMYLRYSRLGAVNPLLLHQIAHGNGWILPFVALLVLESALVGVSFLLTSLLFARMAGNTILCAAIAAGVDVVLFLLCRVMFLPDRIQNNK